MALVSPGSNGQAGAGWPSNPASKPGDTEELNFVIVQDSQESAKTEFLCFPHPALSQTDCLIITY